MSMFDITMTERVMYYIPKIIILTYFLAMATCVSCIILFLSSFPKHRLDILFEQRELLSYVTLGSLLVAMFAYVISLFLDHFGYPY